MKAKELIKALEKNPDFEGEMREIKFRAFDKRTNKMIFVGFPVLGEVTASGIIEQYLFKNKEENECTNQRWNDVILMQYTRFKDKKRKEIYDGDILLNKLLNDDDSYKIPRKVYMKLGWASNGWHALFVRPEWASRYSDIPVNCINKSHEIIGNIYQNPELING